MTKQLTYYTGIFTLLIVLLGCHKEEVPKPQPDPEYPFTYYVLSGKDWEARNVAFQEINKYSDLFLNEYGFVTGKVDIDTNVIISAELLIYEVQSLIERYHYFMGIDDAMLVNVESNLCGYAFPNIKVNVKDYFIADIEADTKHSFHLYQETVNGKIIEFPVLNFNLYLNEKQFGVSGNWFPSIFIPKEKIYSSQDAISIALNYGRENANKHFNVSDDNMDIKVKYIPVSINKKIELHECWCITFWDATYLFYIDTQTGEILKVVDYSGYI